MIAGIDVAHDESVGGGGKWYCAHIVLVTRMKHAQQTVFPVWENVVLLHASSDEQARALAEARGGQDEGDHSGSLELDGQPAGHVFVGIRKIIACATDDAIASGVEVTYSRMTLPSMSAVEQMARGDSVAVFYDE